MDLYNSGSCNCNGRRVFPGYAVNKPFGSGLITFRNSMLARSLCLWIFIMGCVMRGMMESQSL